MDAQKIGPAKLDSDNYPESLQQLVDGIKATGAVDKKMKYLRRIPKDPMTNSYEWGLRSDRDDPTRNPGAGRTFSMCTPRAWTRRAMGLPIRNGEVNSARLQNRRRFGFTLIELMIVMAIIAVLMSVALPIYTRSIQRSKESVLKNNLFTCAR
jgi:prepilin-type N-terminal cleavage/methylation domain-containing protein